MKLSYVLVIVVVMGFLSCRSTSHKSASQGHPPIAKTPEPTSGLNLSFEDLEKEFQRRFKDLSPSSELSAQVLTQMKNLREASFGEPTKIEILDKAIFALDLLVPFARDNKHPYLNEFLSGAHFVVEDGGSLYDEISARKLGDLTSASATDLPLAHQRSSSHYWGQKTSSDISFQAFPIVSELLVGKAEVAGKTITWFQTEGHPVVDIYTAILHTFDYFKYKLTGRNIGFYGTSAYTERDPLRVSAPSDKPDFRFAQAASEQAREIAITNLMKPGFDVRDVIKQSVESLDPASLFDQCKTKGIHGKVVAYEMTASEFAEVEGKSKDRLIGMLRSTLIQELEKEAKSVDKEIMARWGITDERISRRLEAIARLEGSRTPSPASTDRASPLSPEALTPVGSPRSDSPDMGARTPEPERLRAPDVGPVKSEVHPTRNGWSIWRMFIP